MGKVRKFARILFPESARRHEAEKSYEESRNHLENRHCSKKRPACLFFQLREISPPPRSYVGDLTSRESVASMNAFEKYVYKVHRIFHCCSSTPQHHCRPTFEFHSSHQHVENSLRSSFIRPPWRVRLPPEP
jgi:hypothetical protein